MILTFGGILLTMEVSYGSSVLTQTPDSQHTVHTYTKVPLQGRFWGAERKPSAMDTQGALGSLKVPQWGSP